MKFALDIYPERFSEQQSYQEVVRDTLEMVRAADRGGFDIAFTAEHHTIELHISPNPLLTLAFWGAHTRRIRLGTAIITAPYWHPIRLAGEAALVDILTEGRLELGLGRGAYQYEFDRMGGGMNQMHGGDHLRELVPLLRQLWRGDIAHSGECWSFPRATAVPKPLQSPLPIWIAARGEPTFDFAVANECSVMANPFNKPFSEVTQLKQRFDSAMRDHSPDSHLDLLILRRVCVYSDEKDWKIPIAQLQQYGARFENLFRNLDRVENGFPVPVALEEVTNKADYGTEALRDNMIFGTPSKVVDKLGQYADLGIDFFSYGASYGLPKDMAAQSLRLFIDEVMPKFAHHGR